MTCTKIQTLELLVPPKCCNALDEWAVASRALDLLNTQLEAIHSLEEIVINLEEYPGHEPSDDLTKTIGDIGWTVRITRLPKKVWISIDD
jgi:hypothetical protein